MITKVGGGGGEGHTVLFIMALLHSEIFSLRMLQVVRNKEGKKRKK